MKTNKQIRPTAHGLCAPMKVSLLLLVVMMLVPQGAWAMGGSGTFGSPYTIANAADLVAFASKVNGGETGAYAELTADITLTSAWTPIGNSSKIYTGTFDGKSHKISGLSLTATAANAGLFGYVKNATIQNFTLEGSVSSNSDNVGSVVGSADGATKIYNVYSSVNIKMTAAKSHIGGIVGQLLQENGKISEVKGCAYSGTMNLGSSTDSNGGMVGFCEKDANVQIEYCYFHGSISSSGSNPRIGGILGYADDENSQNFNCLSNCYCDGTLSPSSGTFVGAIAGYPRGNVVGAIKNNTYKSGMANNALGNSKTSSTTKAITISAKCSNASDGTIDIAYINPTNTTPTQVKLTVTCADDYGLSKWNDGDTTNPRTVSLTDNINLTATIVRTHYYLTLACSPEGLINITGAGRYEAGASVKIEVPIATTDGHQFQQWSDGVKDRSRTLKMNRDYNLTAEYGIQKNSVRVSSNNEDWGTVSKSQNGYIYTVTATPKPGYKFKNWSDGNSDNPREVIIGSQDWDLVANFAPDYKLTAEPNNPEWGTTKVDIGVHYTVFSAIAKPGYRFERWSNGKTENSFAIYSVTEDMHFIAYFKPEQYTITVATDNSDYGTVSGGGSFDYGSTQTISATPKTGYHFVKWNEDNNTDATRTITVTGDATYTATFAAHTYGEWITDKAATCSTSGTKHRICTHAGCQDREEASIPTLAHDFSYPSEDAAYLLSPATCTADAVYYYKCSQCDAKGETTWTKTGSAKHKFTDKLADEYYLLSPATCTANAVYYYKCEYCEAKGETTWTKPSSALGHQLDENKDCTRCGQKAAEIIAHRGSNGTCLWTIYEDGHMIIQPIEDTNGTLKKWGDAPWYKFREKIISVEFLGTIAVETCTNMFKDCINLTSVDLGNIRINSQGDFANMFYGCKSLQELDLSCFSLRSSQINYNQMFYGCQNLTTLKLNGTFRTGSPPTRMFEGCGSSENPCKVYYVIDPDVKDMFKRSGGNHLVFVESAIVLDDVSFRCREERELPAENVALARKFTPQKPATTMLPFTVDAGQISDATFYELKGVKYVDNEWVLDLQEVSDTVQAYMPYVVIPTATNITFGTGSQTVTFPNQDDYDPYPTIDCGNGWTFAANLCDYVSNDEVGKYYCLAGGEITYPDYQIHVGEFVKCGHNFYLNPSRCYFIKNDGLPLTDDDQTGRYDLNHDGQVNVADLVMLTDILGSQAEGSTDTDLTKADVDLLRQMILSAQGTLQPATEPYLYKGLTN